MLLIVFVFFCVFLFLPKPSLRIGKTLAFFFFSPNAAGSYGQTVLKPNFDILKYIDPLIGTTNGGSFCLLYLSESLSAMPHSLRELTDFGSGHVFPGATLPYGVYNNLFLLTQTT